MTQLGEEIARGSRSTVHAWGDDAVAKVPLPSTPDGWISAEAAYAAMVHAIGVPAPRLIGLQVVGGRTASIFERVWGASMWEHIVADPAHADGWGAALAELHLQLLTIAPPPTIPRQSDRLACKIRAAAATTEPDVIGALALIDSRVASRLCHGDLHPANIIISDDGPVVIDWFDVCRGDALTDVARTSLLLGALGDAIVVPDHLPGATTDLLVELQASYLDRVLGGLGATPGEMGRHRTLALAARFAEGLQIGPLRTAWPQVRTGSG